MKKPKSLQGGKQDTMFNRLAAKLGRQPTDVELDAELDRLMDRVAKNIGATKATKGT
jgi:hypothetical protein